MIPAAMAAVGGALAGGILTRIALRPRQSKGAKTDGKNQSLVFACEELAGAGVDSQALAQAMKALVAQSGADAGTLYLLDQADRQVLTAEAAFCTTGPFEFLQHTQVGHGLLGHATLTLHESRVSISRGDKSASDEVDPRSQAAVAIPLVSSIRPGGGSKAEPRLLGVVLLLSFNNPNAFSGASLDPARALCATLSLAVGYQLLEVFQQKTLVGVMEKISGALEDRDPYSAGHSARAGALAILIGQKLNLSHPDLEELRLGMALHDIGKVAVPDKILHKEDKLTDEEFEAMKTHTMVGFNICKPLLLSPTVLMIIRSHHEKLDGSGYPDGLKGDELPLAVRIAGVAIAFDAMKSKRPWREALTPEETLHELTRSAGRQYDPVVVQTLKTTLIDGAYYRIYPEDLPSLREAS